MGRKGTTIPKASISRIILKSGAKRVSQDAVDELTDYLMDEALKISKRANEISRHAGRKTIHDSDVRLAAK